MPERYTDYDRFAWLYNKYWGAGFTGAVLPTLEELVLQHIPADARILDVACGTGQLANQLTEHGYQVTGIDGSEQMLKFARENSPQTVFLLQDARTFNFPTQYHAIFSMYDSLNHVMELNQLTVVFQNMFRALLPGGYLLFDMNMESGFLTRWNGQNMGQTAEDHAYIVESQYDQENRIATMIITSFFKQDSEFYQRSVVTLTQRAYSLEEIKSAMVSAGFTKVQPYHNTPNGLRHGEGGRTFFLARKAQN